MTLLFSSSNSHTSVTTSLNCGDNLSLIRILKLLHRGNNKVFLNIFVLITYPELVDPPTTIVW